MSKFHDEFFRPRGPKHDELMIKAMSSDNIRKIAKDIPVVRVPKYWWVHNKMLDCSRDPVYSCAVFPVIGEPIESIDYETEVICRSRDFIIGYADAVITRRVSVDVSYEGMHFGIEDSAETLVEIKPTIDDVGAVLRQLKTYQRLLAHERQLISLPMCIVSGEEISEDLKAYLAHEKVDIVVID